MKYVQLTAGEREVISHLLFVGATRVAIAELLGRDVETVRRELKRNSVKGVYSAIAAQRTAEQRRRKARLSSRKMERPEVGRRVKQCLRRNWSPDQIAGRLKHDHRHNADLHVSATSIYHWLHTDEHRRPLLPCLRRYGCRRRRNPPKNSRKRSILGRPEVINRRERLGDWEGDLIVGCGHGGALVSLVERFSGLVRLAKTPDRKSLSINRVINSLLQPFPPQLRRSLTLDNGSEFAAQEQLSRELGIEIYFAAPRSPWQRGTSENTNGLVRQYFPKGTNFRHTTAREIAAVQAELNDRPRKRIGYYTPNEILQPTVIATLQT